MIVQAYLSSQVCKCSHVKSIIRFYVFDIYISLHHLSLKPEATNEHSRRILILLSLPPSQELIFAMHTSFLWTRP